MRLDATARFMQDVATDDASDAALDRAFGWLVRRTLISTRRPARLGEALEVTTWCAGIGRSWAERRTQLAGERGAAIDAVSLWVQVDARTGRPARIAADFLDAYAEAAGGRSVSARLALAGPPAAHRALRPWTVRRTDLDPFGHVNNAATWAFVEEAAELDATDRIGGAELEYLLPIEYGDDPDLVTVESGGGTAAWLVGDGALLAASRWTPSGG